VRFIKWGVLLLLVAAMGAGYWFYSGVHRPYQGFEGAERFVDIPQGTGTAAMARRLADGGCRRGSIGSTGRCHPRRWSTSWRVVTSTFARSRFARG
jgi:hypothetical protein